MWWIFSLPTFFLVLIAIRGIQSSGFWATHIAVPDFVASLVAESIGIIAELILIVVGFRWWERQREEKKRESAWRHSRRRLVKRFKKIHKNSVDDLNYDIREAKIDALLEQFARCIDPDIEKAFSEYLVTDESMTNFLRKEYGRGLSKSTPAHTESQPIALKNVAPSIIEIRSDDQAADRYRLLQLCYKREKAAIHVMNICGRRRPNPLKRARDREESQIEAQIVKVANTIESIVNPEDKTNNST